jgi:pyroglutamyl-peptidase
MTTVLLTGFEPFAGAASNPSWDAVEIVAANWDGEADLVTASLPVEFALAGDMMDALIAKSSPDLVIAVGLANGRAAVTPERIAINIEDARIPDNAGAQPIDRPVVEGGPAAYFTGLPVKAIVERMGAAGIPAELSQTAGTYVCNHLMYRLLHAVHGKSVRAGFIHVPASAALASRASATSEKPQQPAMEARRPARVAQQPARETRRPARETRRPARANRPSRSAKSHGRSR